MADAKYFLSEEDADKIDALTSVLNLAIWEILTNKRKIAPSDVTNTRQSEFYKKAYDAIQSDK
jgi:hypothetical protein